MLRSTRCAESSNAENYEPRQARTTCEFQQFIQLFTVLLTAILISLFFGVLVLVGKIQGTARVVNYAGLVRGKTQRIVKPLDAKKPAKSIREAVQNQQ